LQHLPPRQRAVLLLREVLGWPATEVAEALGTTTSGVNSALQRARAQLEAAAPKEDDLIEPGEPGLREVLERYVKAFEDADADALVGLLRADVVVEMPPSPSWYAGRGAVRAFTASLFADRGPGQRKLLLTSSNGQPAVALYTLGEDGMFHGRHVQVLSVSKGGISRIVAFQQPGLLEVFALPARLDRDGRPS